MRHAISEQACPKNMDILILDDVPFNVALYTRLLTPLDCQISCADNFFEAFILLNCKLPDMIIFNHETINGSCADFCRTIKKSSVLRSIPLIAVIGSKNSAVVQQLLNDGCDHFILRHDLAKVDHLAQTVINAAHDL